MASIIVLLIIIIIVIAMFWLLRSRNTPLHGHRHQRSAGAARKSKGRVTAKPGGLDKLKASEMFWGVEIGQPGCEAAHELLGRQYSFDAAPELPLAGCSAAVCTCQFKGLKEGRTGHRRTHDERRSEIRFEDEHTDRRSPKNRRRGDSWNDHSY